ncbi:hypothetical protein LFU01_00310 [Lysinibacillus fusiformis]|nr:hypothetical protein LFU01_00310 [Lysinibacillus fusiformis]
MFAFLQKIGKSLMFPIATLPAAALLLRLGSGDMLGAVPNEAIQYIASIMAASGNAILGNLPIIFAIGIAMGLAHDSSGGAALAGAIAHLVLIAVLGTVNEELNMGVFGGIIAGITAGLLYNKYYNVKFPEWLSFFGGRRFVPIITSITMAILASILAIVWGPIQGGIDAVGNWMIGAGSLGVGMYGFFNRLLIPVGLHHVINTVIWFDFGEFTNAAGEIVKGDINRFLAGDPTAGHFQAGFFPIMMFGLPAACLAMITEYSKIIVDEKIDDQQFILDLPEDVTIQEISGEDTSELISLDEAKQQLEKFLMVPQENGLSIDKISMVKGLEDRPEYSFDFGLDGQPAFFITIFKADESMSEIGPILNEKEMDIRGQKGTVMDDKNFRSIAWQENGYQYSIVGENPELTIEDLVSYAQQMEFVQ